MGAVKGLGMVGGANHVLQGHSNGGLRYKKISYPFVFPNLHTTKKSPPLKLVAGSNGEVNKL